VLHKLGNRISKDGVLVVKAQTFRTQLENRDEAVKKVTELVVAALKKKKARIATKVSKRAKEQRLDSKKRSGELKEGRRKIKPGHLY
jgi:ribosome-associated protein